MATLLPAIIGQLGNTKYYESTMKAHELVTTVRVPDDNDEWANISIEDRMQRELDERRIRDKLAPYIANKADRFFGSIIVLVEGEIIFEPISNFAHDLPAAYRANHEKFGFITIDSGSHIVLDGQHRLSAIKKIINGDIEGEFSSEVKNDDISVIFIEKQNAEKTRRIFNTVNRYAKQTSRGDNIITSEDDGHAIITRRLLREEKPLGKKNLVNLKSNTLAKRSTQFTTISVVYESVVLLCADEKIFPDGKKKPWSRPTDAQLYKGEQYASDFWEQLISGIKSYTEAINCPAIIPKMRDEKAKTYLLFKPVVQLSLIEGIIMAKKHGEVSIAQALDRANEIKDWGMRNPMWQRVIIRQSGAIEVGRDARSRTANLICYLIASDRISNTFKYTTWEMYNKARGKDVDSFPSANEKNPDVEGLPDPVRGMKFTVDDAVDYHHNEANSG